MPCKALCMPAGPQSSLCCTWELYVCTASLTAQSQHVLQQRKQSRRQLTTLRSQGRYHRPYEGSMTAQAGSPDSYSFSRWTLLGFCCQWAVQVQLVHTARNGSTSAQAWVQTDEHFKLQMCLLPARCMQQTQQRAQSASLVLFVLTAMPPVHSCPKRAAAVP